MMAVVVGGILVIAAVLFFVKWFALLWVFASVVLVAGTVFKVHKSPSCNPDYPANAGNHGRELSTRHRAIQDDGSAADDQTPLVGHTDPPSSDQNV